VKRNALIAFLATVHLIVLAAGWVAPYHYADQFRDDAYTPPMKIGFSGIRPTAGGQPIRLFVHGRLFGVDEPAHVFLFGTDGYGRDVFSRVLYGAQLSLMTGLLATALSLGIGWVLGSVAGFFGGWVDRVVMRGSEFFMALPWLYLLLAIRAFLPLKITPFEAFLLLICLIGGVGWVRPARLIRGIVLSARERPFVLAARGFGAGPIYLIRRHIWPQTSGVLLTQATILIPQYILAEVTLSFLGLGVVEPAASWGNMLADARQYHALVSHPWLLAPGLAAIPVLIGYLFLADTWDHRA
jgi:peptide/nickel transport system permease protein